MRARVIAGAKCYQGTTLSQFKKKGDSEPKRAMTVGSGWSVQRSGRAGDGFVLTAPGRVTKLRASSEQEEAEVIRCSVERVKIKSVSSRHVFRPSRCKRPSARYDRTMLGFHADEVIRSPAMGAKLGLENTSPVDKWEWGPCVSFWYEGRTK